MFVFIGVDELFFLRSCALVDEPNLFSVLVYHRIGEKVSSGSRLLYSDPGHQFSEKIINY